MKVEYIKCDICDNEMDPELCRYTVEYYGDTGKTSFSGEKVYGLKHVDICQRCFEMMKRCIMAGLIKRGTKDGTDT